MNASRNIDISYHFTREQVAKIYRVYRTAEEKKILLKWIGAARWTYNECLGLEDTPYDIRDATMGDLLKAFAAGGTRWIMEAWLASLRQLSHPYLTDENWICNNNRI
ncbi:hypothetical protein V1508DRAFT_125175 [Lipomyces doorenjongii]|uniref:uncharacterized protein n=1 Tax=Lipomyces doorenjongii TaxID=383834 RepID=UPI0034CDF97E